MQRLGSPSRPAQRAGHARRDGHVARAVSRRPITRLRGRAHGSIAVARRFGDPCVNGGEVMTSELVYFSSPLAMVTSYRLICSDQTFELATIRRARIASGHTEHELHVDVDGLEMLALT